MPTFVLSPYNYGILYCLTKRLGLASASHSSLRIIADLFFTYFRMPEYLYFLSFIQPVVEKKKKKINMCVF